MLFVIARAALRISSFTEETRFPSFNHPVRFLLAATKFKTADKPQGVKAARCEKRVAQVQVASLAPAVNERAPLLQLRLRLL